MSRSIAAPSGARASTAQTLTHTLSLSLCRGTSTTDKYRTSSAFCLERQRQAQVAGTLGNNDKTFLVKAFAAELRESLRYEDTDRNEMQHLLKSPSRDLQRMVVNEAWGSDVPAALREWPLAIQLVRNSHPHPPDTDADACRWCLSEQRTDHVGDPHGSHFIPVTPEHTQVLTPAEIR